VDISLVSTAIDDICIWTYYGLQAQSGPWDSSVEYNNGIRFGAGMCSDSGAIGIANKANVFTLNSDKKVHKLICSLDNNVGLGSQECILDCLPSIFTIQYGKTYFNLVSCKNKYLKAGEYVNWKGSYEFK
jgi:hypothetical protein